MKPDFYFHELISKLKYLKNVNANWSMIKQEAVPLIRTLASNPNWLEDKYFTVDENSGFNGYKIHEEDDHTMSIFVTSWLPQRGSPPHNHGTWAISAGVIEKETHTLWKRIDYENRPGFAKISEEKRYICRPGDVITLGIDDIHSVKNESEQVAISLQIYGKHPNFTDRIQIDPLTFMTSSFIGKEVETC